jgi:ElaB/YqjD/DUF883 family membrane-anchored ribosome-binding protein
MYCADEISSQEEKMPHTRDHDGVVDNSPMSRTETQQSGYTPARDFGSEQDTSADRMKQKAVETKDRVQEKVQEKTEEGIDRAAEGVQSAADRIRDRAEERGGMTAEAGTKVADTMERSAQYLREHDSEQIFDDVERYVREHPVQAVAGAIVGGFIIGRLLG